MQASSCLGQENDLTSALLEEGLLESRCPTSSLYIEDCTTVLPIYRRFIIVWMMQFFSVFFDSCRMRKMEKNTALPTVGFVYVRYRDIRIARIWEWDSKLLPIGMIEEAYVKAWKVEIRISFENILRWRWWKAGPKAYLDGFIFPSANDLWHVWLTSGMGSKGGHVRVSLLQPHVNHFFDVMAGSDAAATHSFMDVREWRCWSWRPFKSCTGLGMVYHVTRKQFSASIYWQYLTMENITNVRMQNQAFVKVRFVQQRKR